MAVGKKTGVILSTPAIGSDADFSGVAAGTQQG